MLGDRGYASVAGISHVCDAGGHIVVRTRWTLPIESQEGKRLDMIALMETLDRGEVGDWPVRISHAGRIYPLRLIAIRKTGEATEKTIRDIHYDARKKQRSVKKETEKAAGFIAVLTDLPSDAYSCTQVLELYRMRWQIELSFKRMKSILGFDRLRAKDDALSQTYLLAKILGALVIDELSGKALDFFPWGFRLPKSSGESMENACYMY